VTSVGSKDLPGGQEENPVENAMRLGLEAIMEAREDPKAGSDTLAFVREQARLHVQETIAEQGEAGQQGPEGSG
jgi:hypothetical protein